MEEISTWVVHTELNKVSSPSKILIVVQDLLSSRWFGLSLNHNTLDMNFTYRSVVGLRHSSLFQQRFSFKLNSLFVNLINSTWMSFTKHLCIQSFIYVFPIICFTFLDMIDGKLFPFNSNPIWFPSINFFFPFAFFRRITMGEKFQFINWIYLVSLLLNLLVEAKVITTPRRIQFHKKILIRETELCRDVNALMFNSELTRSRAFCIPQQEKNSVFLFCATSTSSRGRAGDIFHALQT